MKRLICWIWMLPSVACLGAAATQPAASAPGTGGWERVAAEAAFSPRDTAEDAVFRGRLWLSNGYYHGNILSRDLWSSADGRTWKRVLGEGTPTGPTTQPATQAATQRAASQTRPTAAAPATRPVNETPYDPYSELVVFRDALWAVKGSVWKSADGVAWQRVLERTPFGVRGYGETLVHDDAMWQLGSGRDIWRSDDGVKWTQVLADAPFGARSAAAVTTFDGKIWVMGGGAPRANTPPEKGYPTVTTLNDVWCSSDGKSWTRVLERAPWAPRKWFIAREYAGWLWIIGGYDNVHGANLGDVWRTRDGVAWERFPTDGAFTPRHEPTVYVFDGSLWVVAGNAWPVTHDIWRLTLPEGR